MADLRPEVRVHSSGKRTADFLQWVFNAIVTILDNSRVSVHVRHLTCTLSLGSSVLTERPPNCAGVTGSQRTVTRSENRG